MEFGVVMQADPPAWRVVELATRADEAAPFRSTGRGPVAAASVNT